MTKIRCSECGAVIAMRHEDGSITVMCNHRANSGKRCKAVNVIVSTDLTGARPQNVNKERVTV